MRFGGRRTLSPASADPGGAVEIYLHELSPNVVSSDFISAKISLDFFQGGCGFMNGGAIQASLGWMHAPGGPPVAAIGLDIGSRANNGSDFSEPPEVASKTPVAGHAAKRAAVGRDDYSNLFQILKVS